MPTSLLVPELRELLQAGREEDLVVALSDLHPNDVANIVSGLTTEEMVTVLTALPIEDERDIFFYLEPDAQEAIVLGSGQERVKMLLRTMLSDDRAEFVDSLEPTVQKKISPLLSRAAREDLMQRSQFEDDQVGSLISTDYCVLDKRLTSVGAIEELRRQGKTKETIYYAYVTDRRGTLTGFVSLRALIMAPDEETVEEIMRADVVSIAATADQEDAAQIIRDYDLLALPVVDEHGVMVGIITHDDAADIIEEEDTEDIEKLVGVTGESEADGYFDESVWSQYRRRIPVISFLAIFGVTTAWLIGKGEESVFKDHPLRQVLMGLLPMVMATGGMVGTQAATLVVRSITTGGLATGAVMQVLWKELRVSAGMAVTLSLIVFLEAMILGFGDDQSTAMVLQVGLAVAIAMIAHVLSAALVGASVPLLARALRIDPAVVSSAAVTGVADFSGALIYLGAILLLL